MPGFTLITGNRLEYLAQRCGQDLSATPLDPMAQEVISVQSMGMMKWLSLRLAEQCGVWANCRFIFPNRMSSLLLNSFFPGAGNERFFDLDSIPWRVMRILAASTDNPLFAQPAGYIKDDPSGIKIYQLSSGICDVFDQYMTFRPQMLMGWDMGDDAGQWQPELWRMLKKDITGSSPPQLLAELGEMLAAGRCTPGADLPARLTIFGVSYLPLYHINLLHAVSNFIDVRMYMLNPSVEYWGDILREKEKLRIMAKFPIEPGDPESDLHLDSGNPLLAGMGRPGRDFMRNIFSLECETEEHFFEPAGTSLLAMLQNDIFHMRDRALEGNKFKVGEILSDTSIVINSCHSPMREVEVLRDYILDLFDDNPGLDPRDVLVMAPDIELYSGCIESVFSGRDCGVAIPFRIADRRLSGTEPSVAMFFELLSAAETRFTASWVLSVLDCADVMRHFDFSQDDRERITGWISASGIRWGTGPGFRESLGLPHEKANTFSAGIERLLMGLMVKGGGMCMDVLPYGSIEPGDSMLLGRFITFVKSLEKIHSLVSANHSLKEWGEIFIFILDSMFSHEGDVPEAMMSIAHVAAMLGKVQADSGYDGNACAAAVREFCEPRLSSPAPVRDFISGELTFCQMLPMRSIPFRVVCLLGMDAKSFPRRSRPLSFDLIAASPRRGDRSQRDEERYMFLETIISAGEKLYVSYTGQNIVNNTENDPSPVVSELIDYMVSFCNDDQSEALRGSIIRRQRLQRYSPAYFTPGSGLYSYSSSSKNDALAAMAGLSSEPVFFTGGIPSHEKDVSITVNELAWFLRHPAKALCTGPLGISLDIRDDRPMDDEPFAVESSVRSAMDMRLMEAMISGSDTSVLLPEFRAAGVLPHGSAAEVAFYEREGGVKRFLSMLPGLFDSPGEIPAAEFRVNEMTIKAGPGMLYNGGQVFAVPGKMRSVDLLRAWISHLVRCAAGTGVRTIFCCSDKGAIKSFTWDVIDDAGDLLGKLAGLYFRGMESPLQLLPRSSLAYADAFYNAVKEPGAAAKKAVKDTFLNRKYPEAADPYIQKVFGAQYYPGSDFADATLEVYGPLYEKRSM